MTNGDHYDLYKTSPDTTMVVNVFFSDKVLAELKKSDQSVP